MFHAVCPKHNQCKLVSSCLRCLYACCIATKEPLFFVNTSPPSVLYLRMSAPTREKDGLALQKAGLADHTVAQSPVKMSLA